MKDASRSLYICAVTLDRVHFVGPFPSFKNAGDWGLAHLDNSYWSMVALSPQVVAAPLELVAP